MGGVKLGFMNSWFALSLLSVIFLSSHASAEPVTSPTSFYTVEVQCFKDVCIQNRSVFFNLTLTNERGGNLRITRLRIIENATKGTIAVGNVSDTEFTPAEQLRLYQEYWELFPGTALSFSLNGTLPFLAPNKAVTTEKATDAGAKPLSEINNTEASPEKTKEEPEDYSLVSSVSYRVCVTFRNDLVSWKYIGKESEVCYNTTHTIPVYECFSHSECAPDRKCKEYTCVEYACGECQYKEAHSCRDYACCTDDLCGMNERCVNHKCLSLACDPQLNLINRSCVEYACELDEYISNFSCVKRECRFDEQVYNHTCRQLNCTPDQYPNEHKCIALDCAEDEYADNNTCEPLNCRLDQFVQNHTCQGCWFFQSYLTEGEARVGCSMNRLFFLNSLLLVLIILLVILDYKVFKVVQRKVMVQRLIKKVKGKGGNNGQKNQ